MKWCYIFPLLFCYAITNAQTISTYAGCGTGCITSGAGDGGPATASYNHGTAGGVFDKYGNYYFVSPNGSRARQVTPANIIYTIAGNGIGGFSSDGGPATASEINGPTAIVLDTSGNIYIYLIMLILE